MLLAFPSLFCFVLISLFVLYNSNSLKTTSPKEDPSLNIDSLMNKIRVNEFSWDSSSAAGSGGIKPSFLQGLSDSDISAINSEILSK